MNRKTQSRFIVALCTATLAVFSCTSGESTAPPAKVAALPADSQPHFTVLLPTGQAMTTGTKENIRLAVLNVKPQSCYITAPDWLGLHAGADSNSVWTVAPTSSGSAVLHTSCIDYRNSVPFRTDTLTVYQKPVVIPDISGIVPVDVGDSIDVSYDSTNALRVEVTCNNCSTAARLTRVSENTMRFFAQAVPTDTKDHGICFTARGLDGRYTQQWCVTVAIMPAQTALYSVPAAIRASELVPLHTIPVATYDKTGQSNHPDFMRVNAAWGGGNCYMVFTPYFGSNGWVENPSLATSADCEHFSPAAGIKSPLIDKPADGYNSDPELMYDSKRGCMGVVFRQVVTANIVNITTTCDGKTFSAPRALFTAPNHSAVSPTVTQGPDGFNRVWYVDAGRVGCTNQGNVVKMRVATTDTAGLGTVKFGAEVTTDLDQPGYTIWHMKVRYVDALKQYIAMYVAFPNTTGIGDCTNDDLYIATSIDGMHWTTYPTPVMNHLDKRFKFTSLYRASFQYDATTDQLRTIVSGLEKSNWGQYGVVHSYKALVNALHASTTVAAAQLVPSQKLVRKADPVIKKVITEDRP